MSQIELQSVPSLHSFRQRHYSEVSGRSGLTTVSEDTVAVSDNEEGEENEEEADYFQHNKGWKLFLYLPFDSVWANFIISLMMFDLLMLTLVETGSSISEEMEEELSAWDWTVNTLIILDNSLMICAEIVGNLNISYEYMKRPVWLIAVNIFAALPDGIADYFSSIIHNEQVSYYMHLRDLLKVVHVVYCNSYHLQMITKQRVFLAFCNYFLTTYCLFVVINFLYFLQRCASSKTECRQSDILFNTANSIATIIYRRLCKVTAIEVVLFMQLVFSYLIYFFLLAPMVVEIVVALTYKHRHKYAFNRKKHLVEKLLNQSNALLCVRMKIDEFFQCYWQKSIGYSDSELEPFLKTLAPSVFEELVIDMNFQALKHSKLFQNMDLPFLRCVALEMKQTIALPGELLYQKNTNKHTMIYVISGVIQVLSEEDGDTAILSLSAGTCLGETNLIVNCNSASSVVCKEYCVLQTLEMNKLMNLGKKFPKQLQRLRRMVANRCGMAKKLKTLENYVDTTQENVKTNVKGRRIMWLNNTLHRLMLKDESGLSKYVCQNIFLREDFDSDIYETVTSTATYLDLLAIAERTELVSDSIFYHRGGFPPILQPHSVLLNIWNILICIVAIFVCFTTPIYSLMVPNIPIWFWWLVNVASILYIFDIYVITTTAVIKQNLVNVTFKEIFNYRLGTLVFWFDIIAAYPLQLHANSFLHHLDDMSHASLFLNRCLKFITVMNVFRRFISRFKLFNKSKTLIDYVVFNVIITYLILFFSTVMHHLLCEIERSHIPCFGYGKFSFLTAMLFNFNFVSNFLYMIGATLDTGDVQQIAHAYVVSAVIAGIIFIVFLTFVVSKQVMFNFINIHMVDAMVDLMQIDNCLEISEVSKKRILHYIDTQWDHNSCHSLFFRSDVFTEMPRATYKLFKENSFQEFVKNMQVFKDLGDAVIVELCAIADILILPPKEVIAYKEEPATVIYYLVDGFVDLISGRGTAQIIGPGESLSTFEAYLNLPLLNTSVTCTHCKLLALPWNAVKLLIFPFDVSIELDDLKQRYSQVMNKSKTEVFYNLGYTTKSLSFKKFGYKLKIDSEEEYEYYVPFDRLRKFSFIHYFLLRVTFLPNGKFVFIWELLRSICAVIAIILFTTPPILLCENCYWQWVLLFLDLMAVVDIYLKLHYCYYNDKGLLVTHPLKTASHYIKHSFVLDIMSVLPIRFMIGSLNSTRNRYKIIFHYTRYFQIYRAYYLFKGTSLVQSKLLRIIKYFLILLVTTIILSSVLVNTHCSFHEDIPPSKGFTKGVWCAENSFFSPQNSIFVKPFNPFDVCILSVIIVAMFLSNLDLSLYIPGLELMHMIFKHILVIIGYCLYIFLVAKFSVMLTNRAQLFQYQHNMYLLKTYMKREKLSITVKKEMIQYYELQWKKNRNNTLYRFTKFFHVDLRGDIIYDIYGKVLENSSIFHYVDTQFYKKLLLSCKHEAYSNDFTICSVNDIMSMIYILYDGCVDVIAPDGTILTTLTVGSVFGNLEEYPRVRQTVGFVTNGDVEVLVVSTNDYFKHLKCNPKLYNTFKYLTAVHIDYVKSNFQSENESKKEEKSRKHSFSLLNSERYFYRIWQFTVLFLVCYFVNILQIYMIAVNEYNPYIYIFFYIADIVYVLDIIFVRYYNTFIVRTKNLITNRRVITSKRKENNSAFIMALLSIIPLEIPVWFIPMSYDLHCMLLLYLRLNKQLRLYDFFMYIETRKNELNSNLILLRCTTLFCFIGFMLQVLSCLFIKVCCFRDRNDDISVHGRKFNCSIIADPNGDEFKKLHNYGISVYVISTLILTAGQFYQIYKDHYLILWMSLLALFSTILGSFLFAEICSTIRSSLYWRMVYESQCSHLLSFMKRRDVSLQMMKKVWNYVVFFWKRQNGVNFPELLIEAPPPLKLKVLSYCYLHHITKSIIFKKCHEDFLRQLVLTIKVDTYFSGDYIAFKGDINGCMYFIHKGSVLIMSEDTYRKEDVIGKLIVGQYFGVMQGLYPSTAHNYYYQAVSNCDILSLHRETWMYLLDYFPASKEVIYNAAEAYFGF